MFFDSIDNDQKKHLLKLIDFLCQEVLSAGGDGDGIWYSRYYDVKDIFPIIQEYNNAQKFKWENLTLDGDTINLWDNQECLIITNDENKFTNRPSWQQISVDY